MFNVDEIETWPHVDFECKVKFLISLHWHSSSSTYPGVDPTKLFFFANEEFFRFSLVSLRFCYIQKKIIDIKMT